jgi:hypothetical protein
MVENAPLIRDDSPAMVRSQQAQTLSMTSRDIRG